jgi:heme oxygenase (biliverdin-IX-beta and delta-forming)
VSEEPTDAQLARALVDGANRATLCTIGLDPPGYPFGSVANYAVDDAGRPLLFVSAMAPHTANARTDPRASLLVAESAPEGSDPLAVGRVTLIGDLGEVGEGERESVRTRFLEANPAVADYIDFGDFSFWRLEVLAVRWVGGYGRMSWVPASEYAKAGAPRS